MISKWKAPLVCAMGAMLCASARAGDLDLDRFATAKRNQVREYSESLGNKVPSMVWSLFDAVRVDDWETATNLGARLNRASGRFPDAAVDETASPALRTALWAPIAEMIGTYDQFHEWDSKWLHRFGSEVIDTIPRGSVYFGGTDPGRFIISALSESQPEGKPFFVLTQNQLADDSYLDYLRRMYGDRLHIPTKEDMQRVFESYMNDAQQRLQAGRLRPGEDVRMVDGHVQVSGQVAVMAINGLLAKLIVEKNPERSFFVEESYPLDWMYPCLEPRGPIFELHAKPLTELQEETLQRDQTYWKRLTGELVGDWITDKSSAKELCDFADTVYLEKDLTAFKGDRRYARNDAAQKCFSKLRSAIAGLYVWRADHAKDANERAQMQKAAELAYRQAYALCPASTEAVFGYARLLVELRRSDAAFLVGKTTLRLEPNNRSFQELVRTLSRAE